MRQVLAVSDLQMAIGAFVERVPQPAEIVSDAVIVIRVADQHELAALARV
jgi:hypothetical protein